MSTLANLAEKATAIFDSLAGSGGNHLTPVALLEIDGKPFGTHAMSRILSISLTDKRGFEADELSIELSDHDSALALPAKAAKIKLWLGYQQSGVVYKGEYKIAETSVQGAPDTLSITAHAADLSEKMAEQQEKSWHATSLKAIIETIANTHGYEPVIGKAFQAENIAHIDQTNESDAAFLTRLAERYDAIATVKHGRLLFVSAGEATTAGGTPMPAIHITRASGDGFSFRYANTESYQAVRACYTDKKTGKKLEVIINQDNAAPIKETKTNKRSGKSRTRTAPAKKIDTTGLKIKTLRHLYQSQATATTGARAAYKKLKRGAMAFEINLAVGRPDVAPESPVTVQGFKPYIDAESWVGVEVKHTLDGNGLTTQIQLESLIDFSEA